MIGNADSRAPIHSFRSRTPAFTFGTMRRPMCIVGLVIFLALHTSVACAAPEADDSFVEITPALRQARERGLKFLASVQDPDGSYGGRNYHRHVGITALACLAFMADGHLPDRGKYGEQVQKGLEFILRFAQPSGLIAADTSHGPMYGHGFATLFLAEIYGMAGSPRVREALIKAVRLIVTTQNHEGGWRYQPVPFQADISVTVCQVMALRAARNAGISVPKHTIDRATTYVRRCQNPTDGGFRYMLSSGGSAFARSAAGVASLYYRGAGEQDALDGDDAIERGLEYLIRTKRSSTQRGFNHFFYGHYYASQAMFFAGREYWPEWFTWIRESLISRQASTGKWTSSHGDAYGTAMVLLVMQVPNRLLPIFQK